MTATYDLFSPAHFAAPYETFALMRQNDPLYWHEQTGLWFVSRVSGCACGPAEPAVLGGAGGWLHADGF
jgi:hypothetical protein